MKYIILIPSYEPDNKLLILLKSIPKENDIVLVNDGSSISCDKIFNEARKYAHVISYRENQGKGYALKTGLKYIKDNYQNYIVVTVDGDGQHNISDALKLCDYAKDNKDTLVIGKRTWDKTTPIKNRTGNAITRFVYKKITGLSIHDTQTGLRAFSYKLIDYMLNIEGNRYEYEMNALLNLKSNGIKYHEIDIETIYIGKNETSHFNSLKDSYKIYRDIIKWKIKNKKQPLKIDK